MNVPEFDYFAMQSISACNSIDEEEEHPKEGVFVFQLAPCFFENNDW